MTLSKGCVVALAFLIGLASGQAPVTDPEETTTTTEEVPLMNLAFDSMDAQVENCPLNEISFELITGFVYSAPADMLDSRPGTLKLTDCIDMCRMNYTCRSVNFETGLCVLFRSSAHENPNSMTPSQFPVYTLYVQKTCLKNIQSEARSWSFEVVNNFELTGFDINSYQVESRQLCEQACLDETDFICRSANYDRTNGDCVTSNMDRHTAAGKKAFVPYSGKEYVESNYVDNPVRMCEFQKMEGRILKTVDSVFQDVESYDECKKLCLSAPYRCHSFDYGDTADNICRLSHHAAATLTHIQEPYLEIPGASTFELASCYNVTLDCRSGDMVAHIKTSRIFSGKIYSKGSPNNCVNDVTNTLEFDLTMSYNDVDCGIQRVSSSDYRSDIVIQHHDMIVTSADLGLSVHCKYDLSNKSVSNEIGLQITGDIKNVFDETQIVDSPNVLMRITDKSGEDVSEASVGDMLALRFEIIDLDSPYEIFVRDLVALDGADEKKITLLDSQGCPTELMIMRPLLKIDHTGKNLAATFDAFKFPTSNKVLFRALVTPCIPKCEPVICQVMDYGGMMKETESYGRKKRSLSELTAEAASLWGLDMIQDVIFVDKNHIDVYVHPKNDTQEVARTKRETSIPEEMLVEQSIRISDKFGFRGKKSKKSQSNKAGNSDDDGEFMSERESVFSEDLSGVCINTTGLILACSIFLVIQVVLILVWTAIWQRRRHNKLEEPLSHTTTTESLRQLYDSGYPRRI